MTPLSIWLIKKVGFKYTILLSVPIYFFHIFSINYIDQSIFFYHFAWISFGTYMAVFWPAMHSEIAMNGSSKHRGSQIGTLQIISTIFATIAPLVGGFILEYLGYFSLLTFSTFFIIIGVVPLLFSKDISLKNYDFKYSDYIRLFKSKRFKGSRKAFSSEGIEFLLALNLWPIILFILLENNFMALGVLFSFVSFLSIIIVVYIKNYVDKNNKRKVLKLSTRFLSFNWFLRSIIVLLGSVTIYFVETLFKLASSLYALSFQSIFYNNAQKSTYMDYIIFREVYLHGAKMIISAIFIAIIMYFGQSINVLLWLVVIGIIAPVGLSSLREN